MNIAVIAASIVTFIVGYFGGSILQAILSAGVVYLTFVILHMVIRRY